MDTSPRRGAESVKKRVGLVTWHYYSNFGSALQAYALQETIKKMGYPVEIINYRNPKFGKVNKTKELAKRMLQKVSGRNLCGYFRSFQYKYFRQTRLVQDKDALPELAQRFDIFVCGSDQIWAPNAFNSVYMLDFVPAGKKKLSYAASVGLTELPTGYAEKYARLLSDFSAVSVREEAGAKLLRKSCGITAQTVLDPTLLVTAGEWEKLENTAAVTNKKFIFCYFLNAKHRYMSLVKDYAEKNGYEIIGFSENKNDAEWMTLVNIGPREFLWLIHNAETVFTDSYHGTIFSLLYHKKLVSFERFSSSDPICQNSRIYQLNDYFGLDGIIVNDAKIDEIKIKDLDYSEFENRLEKLRENSLDYLSKALER